MRVLITGGAGFVGARLSQCIKDAFPNASITAMDNLRRRGSEINLPDLLRLGVRFVHGDIRCADDLYQLSGNFDVLIEASAEPSVHAGTAGGAPYVFDVNTSGALRCLEFARVHCGSVIFLSTSRVYSIPALRAIPLLNTGTRYILDTRWCGDIGVGNNGINESFTTAGFRSFYGSSKLAAELACEEYAALGNLPVVINRCGVIAGPGQFGKTDQGVFTLWVARHIFGGALSYTGFGGMGYQVRDLLHPRDLARLLLLQIQDPARARGQVFNVGGGSLGAVSLREYTALCEDVTGRSIDIGSNATTAEVDVPWYVTDFSKAATTWGWTPSLKPRDIVEEISDWIKKNSEKLRPLFA